MAPEDVVHREKLISIQSTALWKVVFHCLSRALPIYLRNPGRPPVASPENVECSAAVLLLVVSLESHTNRLMYFEPKELTTSDNLLLKLATFLGEPEYQVLLSDMAEVSVCRDAVTHALLWEEEREFDQKGDIQHQSWRLAGVTDLRSKTSQNLVDGGTITRRLALNAVPTHVDFVDCAKALVVVCRVMRALEQKYGNPKAWVGPLTIPPEFVKAFGVDKETNYMESVIEAVLSKLHAPHVEEIGRTLQITPVSVNGKLGFAGVSQVLP